MLIVNTLLYDSCLVFTSAPKSVLKMGEDWEGLLGL